jgi:hypothetical protein
MHYEVDSPWVLRVQFSRLALFNGAVFEAEILVTTSAARGSDRVAVTRWVDRRSVESRHDADLRSSGIVWVNDRSAGF